MYKQFKNKFQQLSYSKLKFLLNKNPNSNSVLVNSFPKSGTHLLYQIFWKSKYTNDFKSFIASHWSRRKLENTTIKTNNQIDRLLDGELVRAHIFYDKTTSKLLADKDYINYFIFRDPRDVVISEANYLYKMNKFHLLHKHYKNIDNLNDRINFSIMGNDYYETSYTYRNIKDRFLKYDGWLKDKTCHCVKYEDLIGPTKSETIMSILQFFIKKTNLEIDINTLFSESIKSIDPSKSHTFNTGGIAKWKNIFNDENKKIFKEYTGDLLIDLKYEENNDW